jgi:predicted metal-dependent hydrolase
MGTGTTSEVRIGSRTVPYTIRRSERARRMSIRMIPGRGLEVVLPRGYTARDAAAFVRREREWVLRALDRIGGNGTVGLQNGATLPFLDERLTLTLEPGVRARARRAGDVVTVTSMDAELALVALEAWYRNEARATLTGRARVHAATLGVDLRRITIRDTRSRWGSCSGLGNLNFSWRLMLAPLAVMDYVAAHEVAHLRELNHSPRFWQHVESLCPDYREHRLWLRRNGGLLAAWPEGGISHA